MPESDEFWEFYWETRLRAIEDLGKTEAVLAVSRLVRGLADRPGQPVRLLELGCGEGQIIGALVEAHAQIPGIHDSLGVDYARRAIETCRRTYPRISFLEGDFTDPGLMSRLGQFEIVLLVNALHEVFSAGFSPGLGEVDVPVAKQRVQQALAMASERMTPGGYLALLDGLEPSGDTRAAVRIRFHNWRARRRFETFTREYRPFRISFLETDSLLVVELSRRDFTRYITKSIFLEKPLWETERLESYQYYNEGEFREVFARLGLTICELRTFTVNDEKWRGEVEIESPGVDFPAEHILILAQKRA